jgi:hypothetical protein
LQNGKNVIKKSLLATINKINDNNFGIKFNDIMLETFRKLEEQIGNFFGEFENELNSTYRNRAPS